MKMNWYVKVKKRFGLTVSLVLFVFCIILASMLLAGLLVIILHHAGAINLWNEARPEQGNVFAPFRAILPMMVFSIITGTAITAFFSKKALRPIHKFIKATQRIAEGDFNVQLEINGIYELEELSRSFNKMAQELSSIETLRSDFVNNFSHEFKTPIVSIRGFAKLLKWQDLTDEQRSEYIDIIINESNRLTELSTNVLNMAKIEKQNILTEINSVNISEQIRTSILLLEKKWTDKKLYVNADFDEFFCQANEELLKQVWINILDNAIKYADQRGLIEVNIRQDQNTLYVSIKNTGSKISPEIQEKIFDKFYQGDASRSSEGTGIGLAISKKIVDLHNGAIRVNSGPDHVILTVELPLS